jgi:hypothetical protein
MQKKNNDQMGGAREILASPVQSMRTDCDHRSLRGKSATNDADNVIADLAASFDLFRIARYYRDTRGIWDEMLADRTARFAGFSSINERNLPAVRANSHRIR